MLLVIIIIIIIIIVVVVVYSVPTQIPYQIYGAYMILITHRCAGWVSRKMIGHPDTMWFCALQNESQQ